MTRFLIRMYYCMIRQYTWRSILLIRSRNATGALEVQYALIFCALGFIATPNNSGFSQVTRFRKYDKSTILTRVIRRVNICNICRDVFSQVYWMSSLKISTHWGSSGLISCMDKGWYRMFFLMYASKCPTVFAILSILYIKEVNRMAYSLCVNATFLLSTSSLIWPINWSSCNQRTYLRNYPKSNCLQ